MSRTDVPHNTEAENAVVASCLIDPEVYPEVRAIIEPDDFLSVQAKIAFSAMEKLYPGIDFLTVSEATRGKIDPAYLSLISANIPTSVHAVYYAEIVSRLSHSRKLITAAGQIAAIGYEAKYEVYDTFLEALEILHNVEPQGKDDLLNGVAVAEYMQTMISNRIENATVDSVPFGYYNLDNMTGGGMFPGNMVVVGARPGVGKTQLLIEISLGALYTGRTVMTASAEMSLAEWCEREIAMESGVSVKEQRRGEGLATEKVVSFIDTASRFNRYWMAEPVTISRIVNKARALKRSYGLDLLIVDYIQLIADTVTREHGSNTREKVGYISRTLKRLAKELEIPVLVAAQLNRDVETRASKVPQMSDIKEAGDIEQDADVIILMHRPSLYVETDRPNITELFVPKMRQMGLSDHCVSLVWLKKFFRHGDYTKG